MAENEQGTFKPQFGAELNIESIIGAPLVAASGQCYDADRAGSIFA